jgi:hypothetical protein
MAKDHWCNAPAAVADRSRQYARAAVVALAVYLALFALAASLTRLMLNADGAYFVFVLGSGDPWLLKWADLPTRISTYLFTVVPTELVLQVWKLTGSEIAAVNALTFYGFQLIQFLIVIALAWRRHSQFLIFPVAQYAFSTLLGLGFPSEALLEPGFFWICMFCLLRDPLPRAIFAFGFGGLIFSHEIAIFAVVVVFFWLKFRKSEMAGGDHRYALIVCVGFTILWALVRLSGLHQADYLSIHVLDPRRVFNNPTLWLIALASAVLACWAAFGEIGTGRRTHMGIAAACLVLPWLFEPWVNFAQGRYETGRTLTGVEVPLLGIAMLLAISRRYSGQCAAAHKRLAKALVLATTAALAINVSSASVFISEWTSALLSLQRYVRTGQPDKPTVAVTLAEASADLGVSAAEAIQRTGYSWSWPYRSVVLADNYKPGRFIYDPEDVVCEAGLPVANRGTVPLEVRLELTKVTCTPEPPHPLTIRERLIIYIEDWIRRLHQGLGFIS